MTTQPPPAIDIDQLRELAKAATAAPWQVYEQPLDLEAPKQQAMAEFERLIDGQEGEFHPVLPMLTDGNMCPAVTGCGPKSMANAKLIAAMRNSFEAMLQELAELRGMKLRVHELAADRLANEGPGGDLAFEIERLTR